MSAPAGQREVGHPAEFLLRKYSHKDLKDDEMKELTVPFKKEKMSNESSFCSGARLATC